MPIHEYQCVKCGTVAERISFTNTDEKVSETIECTKCMTEKCEKIMSVNGAIIVHGYNSNNGYAGHMR